MHDDTDAMIGGRHDGLCHAGGIGDRAVLIGGPEDLPSEWRVQHVTDCPSTIKCEFKGKTETFRYRGERIAFDPTVLIYEWSH